MLELRWMKSGDGHEDSPLSITLQYRERRETLPKAWITGQQPPVIVEWTDWQDVPVVDRQGFTLGYGGTINVDG